MESPSASCRLETGSKKKKMVRNYYQVLGVTQRSSQEQIRRAFRRLAKRYHPDVNSGSRIAEERFKAIAHAYDVLSDTERRLEYDQVLVEQARRDWNRRAAAASQARAKTRARPEPEHEAFVRGQPRDFSGLDDILDSLFGERDRRKRPFRWGSARRGEDLFREIKIPFELAVKGGKTELAMERELSCPRCGGTGAKPGTRVRVCSACKGSGLISRSQGDLSVAEPCAKCQGRGTRVKISCPECKGCGRVVRQRRLQVAVPAGVRQGARVELPGQGQAGKNGGPPGNLSVAIRVAAHPDFRRIGFDVETRVWIDIVTAALGGWVSVPTLSGQSRMTIPEGTRSGTRLRIKGGGVPRPDGAPGDLIVAVGIRPPKRLSEEQKRILKELRNKLRKEHKGE